MFDILHDFPVIAEPGRVFDAIATPVGLDAWWTLTSNGTPHVGAEYQLGFGPEYDWRARVTRCEAGRAFELEMTASTPDWLGSTVGFELEPRGGTTWVRFHHRGWAESSEHYRISSFCWAMYLRILKKHVEDGLSVPYERRLDD